MHLEGFIFVKDSQFITTVLALMFKVFIRLCPLTRYDIQKDKDGSKLKILIYGKHA